MGNTQSSAEELCARAAACTEDEEKFRMYEQASALGSVVATTWLGKFYEEGRGVAVDMEHAVELYTQAANLGYKRALNNLGYCYMHGMGVELNYKRAVELFQQAGTGAALSNLGYCYQQGYGVEKSLKRARELFSQAAALGIVQAITHLANITEDNTEALRLYNRAAEAGNKDAMKILADIYTEGNRGVKKDIATALAWHQKELSNQ